MINPGQSNDQSFFPLPAPFADDSASTLQILGDEFFFAWITKENSHGIWIAKYLKEVQKRIVQIAAHIQFLQSEKTKLIVKESEIIVRTAIPISKEGLFSRSELPVVLATLSVSGFCLLNRKVAQENWKQKFQTGFIAIQEGMEQVKNTQKGILKIQEIKE